MDGTVDELLVFAAKQVSGRPKRSIFAVVCEKLCDGSARKTEERFGWSREAVAKGLIERNSEREDEIRVPRGGVKPSEDRNPQLAIDIRLIVEPHTHSDPELKSTRLCTNFSAAEVRSALRNMGYAEDRLPIERCWSSLQKKWNGVLLTCWQVVRVCASRMTWKGQHPSIVLVEGNYPTGVIVPKQEMTEINKRLIRSELLPSYDILIMPKRPRGR